ncbi:MAG: cysteine desulfurase NifS [Synergistaceae bacterium]|jgi:cysteine desulfurase|nr:cysteine desulfurase NifS [Synergistaceae bacterium]
MNVYLDYSATTPTDPEVLAAMTPYFTEVFGNPSSVYSLAAKSRAAIDKAREQVAAAFGAHPEEIFFTGSGTEADNWALKGAVDKAREAGKHGACHVITSAIEHHAILHTADYLEKHEGVKVTYLPVDSEGRVSIDDLRSAATDETVIVSIMFANNEIGTIEPIKAIGEFCRERGILFHTDAVQAAAQIPIDVQELKIDMMSMSAHKMYGPKGTGAFYLRRGVKVENFVHGGGQEKGRRASTENIAGIVGMGFAAERMKQRLPTEKPRLTALRDRLIDGILKSIPHAKLNGARGEERLPNNVNFSFIGVEGETLLLDLDANGISASTGSACTSGSLDPSHVLMAIGLSHELAHGSLRMTLGRGTTDEHIGHVLSVLPGIVARRRSMSPVWEQYVKEHGGS